MSSLISISEKELENQALLDEQWQIFEKACLGDGSSSSIKKESKEG